MPPISSRQPEQWCDIKGVPDYQVSDHGRVRSRKTGVWKVLKTTSHSRTGYLVVSFRVDRKYIARSVHRVVASAFLGDASGFDVNHINGDKHDNRLCNLEYLTRGDNHRHAYRSGLRQPVGLKLSSLQVQEIRSLCGELTQAAIARRFGVSRSSIGKVLNGQTHIDHSSSI
jgi:hypothetical protein